MFNVTGRCNVKLQLATFRLFPILTEKDAVTGKQVLKVFLHVYPPVRILWNAILERVHYIVEMTQNVLYSLCIRLTLFQIVVRDWK